jgi:hypothetical protein
VRRSIALLTVVSLLGLAPQVSRSADAAPTVVTTEVVYLVLSGLT